MATHPDPSKAALLGVGPGPSKPASYGTFRPQTAPVSRSKPLPPIDDPRHSDESPMPWLRYFFPKDFELREGKPVEPFYQFFDIFIHPLREDTAIPPPDWAPNAYFQLSFTQLHVPPGMVLATRVPKPPAPPAGSVDLAADNAPLLKPGNERLLADILAFARSVATFKARTWKDALPLVDLLRGVLLHLLNHYTLGGALLKEAAKKDAEEALAAEKAALKKWYAQQLEEGLEKARREYEEKLEALKEDLRMSLAEDLTLQLRAERDEKNQLRQQMQQLEAQLRKAQETQLTLQRQLEHGAQQLEVEASRHKQALAARDAQAAAAAELLAAARRRLAAAQAAVVEALGAKTKQEALGVALNALSGALPQGTAAYVAELRTAADVDGEDPAAGLIAEAAEAAAAAAKAAAEGGGDPAPLPAALQAMAGVTPGLMSSPLAAVVGGGVGEGGSRPSSAIAQAGVSEITETLVFKYIRASAGQEFMLGQKLAYGSGVSWRLLERPEVSVPNVAAEPSMVFFQERPASASKGADSPPPPAGSYFAAPIRGAHGEVVGMLCVDTLRAAAAEAAAAAAAVLPGAAPSATAAAAAAAAQLAAQDQAFIRGLADALGARVRADAEAYEQAMLAKALAEEAPEPAPAAVDPLQFVEGGDGVTSGLKLFSEALGALRGVTDEELAALQELDAPDDVTLAVVKSILAAVGEVGAEDWAHARQHITRDLLKRLLSLDPQQAWAEWQALCKAFRPMNELSASSLASAAAASDAAATPSLRASGAFARWATSVRTVSAAKALQGLLEAKLQRANAALIKAFSGDSSNALTELRSYRVPPPLTFGVLQCVLMLSGNDEEDCRNWARMRMLTNHSFIKKLVTLRPAQVPRRVFKAVKKLVGDLVEGEVKQESQATLLMYHWLSHFTRLAAVS